MTIAKDRFSVDFVDYSCLKRKKILGDFGDSGMFKLWIKSFETSLSDINVLK